MDSKIIEAEVGTGMEAVAGTAPGACMGEGVAMGACAGAGLEADAETGAGMPTEKGFEANGESGAGVESAAIDGDEPESAAGDESAPDVEADSEPAVEERIITLGDEITPFSLTGLMPLWRRFPHSLSLPSSPQIQWGS